MNVKRLFRGPIFWIVLAVIILLFVVQMFMKGEKQIETKRGLELLNNNKVEQALMIDREQRVDLTLKEDLKIDGKNYSKKVYFYYVEPRGDAVAEAVTKAEKPYDDKVPSQSMWSMLLINLLPMILFIALFWFLMTQAQGGGSRVMQFGKSKAKLVSKETPTVTFADVAGSDEAVEELDEIREFLSEPAKFQAVGAKIPKGVLLYGQPGTGKTLLARAVAGEAGVPFYSISGSDFVEMFVGVGASRVRDLFEQAKNNAPAIIFVDEIDAVGRHRGAGMGGGHDEREQTLNQLLVEMDGFDVSTNVILIAATNRPDILDPALLRPGRFDRQIGVDPPDMNGRSQILQVHAKGKPMAPSVDLKAVARRTPGMTGADLANVLNEAALLTARNNAQVIDNLALDEAIDRVIAGPQRRTRIMKDREKLVTAYHEGGHAIVAAAMRHTDPVTKITILPRGRALGYVMVMPAEDKYSTSRNELLDQLAYALGGRVAEEVIFHDPTTGASNDIEKATSMARSMVTQYGMSENIGAVKLGQSSGEVFLGKDMGHERDYSESLAATVDAEVRRLIEAAHDEAYNIIVKHRDILDHLVRELLEHETLNKDQVAEIFAPLPKQDPRPQWLSHERRVVSTIPPIEMPAQKEAPAAVAPAGGIGLAKTAEPSPGAAASVAPTIPQVTGGQAAVGSGDVSPVAGGDHGAPIAPAAPAAPAAPTHEHGAGQQHVAPTHEHGAGLEHGAGQSHGVVPEVQAPAAPISPVQPPQTAAGPAHAAPAHQVPGHEVPSHEVPVSEVRSAAESYADELSEDLTLSRDLPSPASAPVVPPNTSAAGGTDQVGYPETPGQVQQPQAPHNPQADQNIPPDLVNGSFSAPSTDPSQNLAQGADRGYFGNDAEAGYSESPQTWGNPPNPDQENGPTGHDPNRGRGQGEQ